MALKKFAQKRPVGGRWHKVSPKSTDPVYLYSQYSYLQNVNTMLLGSILGPTLSCLLAEKS